MNELRMIKIGEVCVCRNEGTLASVGVGSCIIIILYYPAAKIGGMGHVLLPAQEFATNLSNPLRFPGAAVHELLLQMENLGAQRSGIWAKIVGGASLFSNLGKRSIGVLNVHAAKEALSSRASI